MSKSPISQISQSWLEVEKRYHNLNDIFSKRSREYISAQIDEYLQTPIKERFSEKKYYLVAHPEALAEFGSSHYKYISEIYDTYNGFGFQYGPAKEFSESELKEIEQSFPILAEAIETMKRSVEED